MTERKTLPPDFSNSREGHRQRIREKYYCSGAEAFYDYELLELLLTYALPRKDVRPLAHQLIRKYHSIRELLATPAEELEKMRGIGKNTVILLKLIDDISARGLQRGLSDCDYMDNPEKFCDYARTQLKDYSHEVIMLFCLNSQNKLIDVSIVSEGQTDSVPVSIPEIAKKALKSDARCIVLCHNHPGGSIVPSAEDDAMTKALRKLLAELNIILLDHIIVSRYDYYSYRAADCSRSVANRLLAPYPGLINRERKPL